MFKKVQSLLGRKAKLQYTDAQGLSHTVKITPGSSVLDQLLDAGHSVPHSCKAGVCQSCIMQTTTPEALCDNAQKGLNPNKAELGFFLSCACQPEKFLSCSLPNENDLNYNAKVLSKEMLNTTVLKLELSAPFGYKAGQFCNLQNPDGIRRSYSIASPSDSDSIEFHIKLIHKGKFSSWADNDLKVGDQLEVQGPFGECFYAGEPSRPLLLAGIGTGLAPLVGIIKDAINKNHTGKIHLLVGAKNSANFYYVDTINRLAHENSNFSVDWLSMDNADSNDSASDIYAFAQSKFQSLENYSVFLCGAQSFVHKMKKQCYLADAKLCDIHCDSFLPAQ